MSERMLDKVTLWIGHIWHRLAEHHVGIYEILDYDSTLELCDAEGHKAVFKRFQKVRFLQDNVTSYQDHAWGDGEIFGDYICAPGVVADKYQEGERWNILISLRETKSRGDVEDIYIERTVIDGFTQQHEWRQTAVWHPTHRLRLAVIFPEERHCKRAILQIRRTNQTIELDNSAFRLLGDGRQMVTWETKNPGVAEVFTLRWVW